MTDSKNLNPPKHLEPPNKRRIAVLVDSDGHPFFDSAPIDPSWGFDLTKSNPTDIHIGVGSTIHGKGVPVYSKEWQEKTAKEACQEGFIDLHDLVYIMAKDDGYTDILSELWERYGLDLKLNDSIHLKWYHHGEAKSSTEKEINATTEYGRAGIWYWLLWRWVVGNQGYFFGRMRPIKLLDLYDPKIKKSQALDVGKDREEYVIHLNDLADYLKKRALPLPLRLYPDERSKQLPQEVINLIQKIKPETEMIYDAIRREVGFSGRNPQATYGNWKEKAKTTFAEQENVFGLLTAEHLEEDSIYVQLGTNQGRRDFIGPLLRKIVQEHTGNKIGAERLYDQYKKIP